MIPSAQAMARDFPPGMNSRHVILPGNLNRSPAAVNSLPERALKNRTLLTAEPEASVFPSGEKAKARIMAPVDRRISFRSVSSFFRASAAWAWFVQSVLPSLAEMSETSPR
jgi:hypothetical protein